MVIKLTVAMVTMVPVVIYKYRSSCAVSYFCPILTTIKCFAQTSLQILRSQQSHFATAWRKRLYRMSDVMFFAILNLNLMWTVHHLCCTKIWTWDSRLLRCYAVAIGNYLPTFRRNFASSSNARQTYEPSKRH